MSEITHDEEQDEQSIGIESYRRILGIQIAAKLVSDKGQGIEEMLTYADQIETFLEKGLSAKAEISDDYEGSHA